MVSAGIGGDGLGSIPAGFVGKEEGLVARVGGVVGAVRHSGDIQGMVLVSFGLEGMLEAPGG